MNKINPNIISLAFSIMSFTFTSTNYADGPACEQYLFYVYVIGNVTCNQATQSNLTIIQDVDSDGILSSADYTAVTATSHPFGCLDNGLLACAIGYHISQFESIYTGGIFAFRVKNLEVRNYKCCVKKNLN